MFVFTQVYERGQKNGIQIFSSVFVIIYSIFAEEDMQKRLQQLAGAALDSLGLSKIEDTQLLGHLRSLDEMEVSLRLMLSAIILL